MRLDNLELLARGNPARLARFLTDAAKEMLSQSTKEKVRSCRLSEPYVPQLDNSVFQALQNISGLLICYSDLNAL